MSATALKPQKAIKTCGKCNRTFTKGEHLRRHERTHNNDKPFTCTICRRHFSRNDTLQRHYKTHPPRTASILGSTSTSQPGQSSHSNRAEFDQWNEQEEQPLLYQSKNSEPILFNHVYNEGGSPARTVPALDVNKPQFAQAIEGPSAMPSFDFATDQLEQPTQWEPPTADLHFPLWMADAEFDVNALNSWVASSLDPYQARDNPGQSWGVPVPLQSQRSGPSIRESPYQPVTCRQSLPPISPAAAPTPQRIISEIWFSHVEKRRNFPNTNDSGHRAQNGNELCEEATDTEVDEVYRTRLATQVRSKWTEDLLPSTEFLNLCIQLYFTKFGDIFPLIHRPSFRASQENYILLLSLSSLGSLFVGSDDAKITGRIVFEKLNKLVLASWEKLVGISRIEKVAIVQGGIIAQSYALLSGVRQHFAISEAFHGLVLYWARSGGMFQLDHSVPDLESLKSLSASQLDKAWRNWAAREATKRAALSLVIQDAELSFLIHHETSIRPGSNALQLACGSSVFSAPDAATWLKELENEEIARVTYRDLQRRLPLSQPLNVPKTGLYSLYIALVEIGAAVCDERACDNLYEDSTLQDLSTRLICWYRNYEQIVQTDQDDPFCLMIYWHVIFVFLCVDVSRLESAVGRDAGFPETASSTAESVEYAQTWSASNAAKRAVIHVYLVHKSLGRRRLDEEPAIHVPRAVFQAALVLYCYAHFWTGQNSTDSTSSARETNLDFPEIKLLGHSPSKILLELHGFQQERCAPRATAVLWSMHDLLLRAFEAAEWIRILDGTVPVE